MTLHRHSHRFWRSRLPLKLPARLLSQLGRGLTGMVIHQSGVCINPLAHSALPDAEANVIRNLMARIDQLENQVGTLQACLKAVAAGRPLSDVQPGKSQNLKDREILEFLGDRENN